MGTHLHNAAGGRWLEKLHSAAGERWLENLESRSCLEATWADVWSPKGITDVFSQLHIRSMFVKSEKETKERNKPSPHPMWNWLAKPKILDLKP